MSRGREGRRFRWNRTVAGLSLLIGGAIAQEAAAQEGSAGEVAGAGSSAVEVSADTLRARILDRVRLLSEPPVAPDSLEGPERAGVRADSVGAPGRSSPLLSSGRSAPRESTPSLELPTGADSVMQALANLPGYRSATYEGGRAEFEASDRRLTLYGSEGSKARFSGQGIRLEADSAIFYDDRAGRVRTLGNTTLTPQDGDPVESDALVYDVPSERGTALGARTRYQDSGHEWLIRGDLNSVQDGLLYGSRTRFTSSPSDPPRSFFEARELKVVANRILIARSVRLYFDDVEEGKSDPVPVAWLPFLAQPLESGRTSGILTPRFSVNDIVQTSSGTNRRLSNIGYYWTLSDYADLTLSTDWWSERYTAFTGGLRYRWAQQFLQGDAALRRYWSATGSREFALSTRNNWEASERTRLRASGNFVTNTGIVRTNSLDPRELTGSVDSNAGLEHRFRWGALSLSSTRKQYLNDDRVEMTLPSASISMSTLTLFGAPPNRARWYNNLSVNGSSRFDRTVRAFSPPPAGAPFVLSQADQVRTSASARASTTLGNLSLGGNFRFEENLLENVPLFWGGERPLTERREGSLPFLLAAPRSGHVAEILLPGELDLRTGERVNFASAQSDWDISLGYQQRLIGASTLTPSISIGGGMARVDSIPDAQSFVNGPNRVSVGLSAQTEIFGFYRGFGPFDALRHKLTPGVSWGYSPATSPTALQEQVFGARSLRVQNQVTFSFNQTWEARRQEAEPPASRRAGPPTRERTGGVPTPESEEVGEDVATEDDSSEDAAAEEGEAEASTEEASGDGLRRLPPSRVITLLGLATSAVAYDVVQADSTGRFVDGFTTTRLSNSVRSDYLRGLDLSFTHALFDEPDFRLRDDPVIERRLAPHLEQVSLGFSMSNRSGLVRWLADLLGVDTEEGPEESPAGSRTRGLDDDPFSPADGFDSDRVLPGMPGRGSIRPTARREGWDARLAYSLRRPREALPGSQLRAQMVTGNFTFAPTENWDATWQTSYDVETRRFNDHMIRLGRDLQEWEASFGFRQTAFGNWSFQFEVALKANRDLRFDHEQRSYGDGDARLPGFPF